MTIRLAVLLSGGGTTLQNILDHIGDGKLDAQVACVISSRADAYGLERARKAGIPALTVARKDCASAEEFNRRIWDAVRECRADLTVLAGFMSKLEVPDDYVNRVMNVHPALIPAFCGQGMYGHHVHEAVLAYGVKETGATVHFVDREYDHGPIILQMPVHVFDDDTPESLAERVQVAERGIYPKAIRYYAEGRLEVRGRHVRIRHD